LCNKSWSVLLETSFDVFKSILSVTRTTYCKQFSRIFVLYTTGVIFHKHSCKQYNYQSIHYRLLKAFPFWFLDRQTFLTVTKSVAASELIINRAVNSCDYSY
jgi:hypothetical protein